MAEIVGIRFKKVGKVYYFDPCGIQTQVGQNVIVETARGVEYGEVALANRELAEGEMSKPLKKLIRIATPSDAKVVETNQKRAEEAFHICEQKILEHHLDMKLVSVEYTFDLSKVLFYFTADGRVDFRDLVKDLASIFRTRIELRQIGVRDEAKVLGGLGICGRPLCCSSFLDDFQPVSINMAKEQSLSLNPTKISGTCGRLMCCLKYEHEVYSELSKITPRPDSLVETPDGPGVVIDSSILRGTCAVRLDGETDEIHTYKCADCQVVRSSRKGRRSSNVATRAAAAAALSGHPKKEDPMPTFPDARPVSLAPVTPEVSETPAEKIAGADQPAKSRRRRRRNHADGAHRDAAPAGNSPREKRSHPERASKATAPSEKKEGGKPRRRRRSFHHGRRSGSNEAKSTPNK